MNSLDWSILNKALKKNVDKQVNNQLLTHRKKLKKLTRNRVLPFTHKETVTNLSSHQFSEEELELLKNGLGFAIKPPKLNSSDILATFERIHWSLKAKLRNVDDHGLLKNELAHLAQSYISSYRPTPSDLKRYHILKKIRNNHTIIILKPDKGNGVVIMDKQAYLNACYQIINNRSKFKPLNNDVTLLREGRLQRFLRKLKRQGSINDELYFKLYPTGSQPARFYGLPKMHKLSDTTLTPPLRPIVSSINTYNYNLAKHLCTLLTHLIPNDYTTKDSFSFVNEFNNLDNSNKYLISYDIQSLFCNIPLLETIDLAVDLIHANNINFPINKTELKQLFLFATSETHFLFNGSYFDQIDGVSMGSPLAPVLANLFLSHHERTWLSNFKDSSVLFYRRYVDDIFCMFHNEPDALLFFNYLNLQHPNIKFTFEKEDNNQISFLDIRITKSADRCITSVFHKKTYTGLLLNFLSFSPLSYKAGLVRTLVDRARKINNSTSGFRNDLNKLILTLKRNCFPSHFIDKIIKIYEEKHPFTALNVSCPEPQRDTENIRYFKLPYIGHYSKITQKRLTTIINRYCLPLEIKLVFSQYKIKNLFSFKDPLPSHLKSGVVYKFTCAVCNSRYIGETMRHLSTRIKEHTSTDKNSHIYKHFLSSPNCKSHYTDSCFTILDTANFSSTLKIKEALHINKLKPELNKQVQHFNTIFNL